jgi:hypothetical protein
MKDSLMQKEPTHWQTFYISSELSLLSKDDRKMAAGIILQLSYGDIRGERIAEALAKGISK